MLKNKLSLKSGEIVFFLLPFALAIFGLLMISEVSSVSALRDFGNKFYYLQRQAIWFGISIVAFFVSSVIDYRKIKKIALPFLIFCLLLLVLVLIPGIGREIYGGRRWIFLGTYSFQPAELAKLSLIFYLSTLFEKRLEFLPFLTTIGLILILLLLEPDLGTALIIIATAFSLYFVAGAPAKQFALISFLGILTLPFLIFLSPYRKQRFLTFLESSFSPEKSSYHVKQVLLALGTGGIFGRGLGQSRQKFLFLPEVSTDSIFAIIAEEFGFIGSVFLILLFIYLIMKGLKLACAVEDNFSKLLSLGIIMMIGFQTIINLGSMVTLFPITGVPLPFVSYGGSSLLVSFIGMGIVYNISKRGTHK